MAQNKHRFNQDLSSIKLMNAILTIFLFDLLVWLIIIQYNYNKMMRRSSTTNSTKSRANFKIVMVGERGVGKTSLLMRYDRGVFCKTFAVTIGIESFYKELILNSEKVGLQFWDTAGQEGFKSLVKSFYSQACCVIIAYSDPQRQKRTIDSFLKEIGELASEFVTIAVVRTKIDQKAIAQEEKMTLEQYVASGKIKVWRGVSAKQGTQVQSFFEDLGASLLEKYEDDYQFQQLVRPTTKKSIMISKTDLGEMQGRRKKACCNV